MKTTPTIIVLIIAAVLVAAVWFAERRERTSSEHGFNSRLIEQTRTLPVDAVTRMILERGTEAPMIFERDDAGWKQVEPFPYPMDPFSIRQLAAQAVSLEAVDALTPGDDRDFSLLALGLAPPRASLRYEWPDGTLTLRLGRRGMAGRSYIQVEGSETVYVVKSELHDRAVVMDPREWRDRQLFQHAGVESDRIERTEGTQRLVLSRDRRTWTMREPVETRLDPLARDDLFQALGRAQAGGFILDQPDQEALSQFGLASPAATLSVTTTRPVLVDGQMETRTSTQRLRIGATVGVGSLERFAMVEDRPVIIKLEVPVMQALFKPVAQLIDPTASGVNPADVKSIRIQTVSDQFEVRRTLDNWIAPGAGVNGEDVELHAPHADELVQQLTQLRAPVAKIQAYPRDLEVAVYTLYGTGRKPLTTIRVVHDDETGNWAMENGDDVLRMFSEGFLIRFSRDQFGLPPATLPAGAPD